ncbi:MAG: Na+/H+ antiporter NhaA [Actinobacteria bacterium HGW-Actinobacteria-10]|nr:MAG: Na+/H+ antiporter NhaA [Actinobacteria bacterium HGW-Actinobacteria-10]
MHGRVREGFGHFVQMEVAGSLVLLVMAIAALVFANSPLHEAFDGLWHTYLGIHVDGFVFEQSLLHWIDDGLMAIFFFVVGLEIKREIIVGELSSVRKATLPILAAVGGMIGPAVIYALVNMGGEGARGWGIPMATDIAFALGVLAILGSRIPANLKVFLAALAIVDDIGAVIVIAAFYTSEIFWGWLLVGLGIMVFIVVLNILGVESPIPYAFAGTAVWFCFLNSGVHATIAGVLVAFAIPSKARMLPLEFVEWARTKLEEISMYDVPGEHVLTSNTQQHCAQEIQAEARWIQAPLQRMEHALLPVSTFVILPLFGLANAGVRIAGYDFLELILEPVSVGIILGLVFGKQIGIYAMSRLAVGLGIADLPEGVTWRHVYGASLLGGIGFTMSLFISGLAFRAGILQAEAKMAIIVASLIAGVAGYLVLRGSRPEESRQSAVV